MSRFAGLKLLAFVMVCLLLTGYLAFTIGNIRPSHLWFLHRDYTLTANFDDVSGLNAGDDVKVAGVIVGKVTSISVVDGAEGRPRDGTGRAQVTLSVHKSVRLPANSSASIRWRNLLGQRYIYLNPPAEGEAQPVVLQPGATVSKTTSVVDIGELFNRLGPVVAALDPGQVNQFIDAVSGALAGNEQNLSQTLDNLATITASLAAHDDAIGRLVGNVDTVAATVNARDREIRTVLDNLVAISATFSANTRIVDDAVTNLGTVSTNLDRLLGANQAQIDRIIANVDSILKVMVAKLPTIDATLKAFPLASQKLFSLSALGQFLDLTIPCLSVQLLAGTDAVVPCNTPLNNPGPSGGRAPAATGPAAPTAPGPGATAPAGRSAPTTRMSTAAPAGGGRSGEGLAALLDALLRRR